VLDPYDAAPEFHRDTADLIYAAVRAVATALIRKTGN